MRFLLLVEDRQSEPARAPVRAQEMIEFGERLRAEGVLLTAAGPFAPDSQAVRLRVTQGSAVMTDGPFDDPLVVGGCYLVEVADRAAAIELAKRCPWARAGVIEVRGVHMGTLQDREVAGPLFAFLYLMEPAARAASNTIESGIEQMRKYTVDLFEKGVHVAGGRLPPEIPPAFVEVRGTQTLVTDGPFAETKEVVAGFALMRVGSRAEALELAARAPHAQWGTVEVREVHRPAH